MSVDLSRVARAITDLSTRSSVPLKLSHAQQCVAACFGFKSLAAYQAAKKLETTVDDNGMFVVIDNHLLSQRAKELEAAGAAELAALIQEAINTLYPAASVYFSEGLRRYTIASAIAHLVGLNPVVHNDLDDAPCQFVENTRGELQGFIFNFDVPEWQMHASHIRDRHGSLSVYVPAAFLQVVTGCEEPQRYYLHGDQVEGKPHQYFCRRCDQFADAAHFEDQEHSDNGERYFRSMQMWSRGIARWKLPLRRPNNAPNLLAAKADRDRRLSEAARSDFHRWIEQQVHRNDKVGDLAKDIMRDEKFPDTATTRQEVVAYIKAMASWQGPVTAINQALNEFDIRRQAELEIGTREAPTWPMGPAAINAIVLPPDQRAMLVPQLTILELPGRVRWRFNDDDFESTSDNDSPTLEQALESAGTELKRVNWVDVNYFGVVMGGCHAWELLRYAAKIAADLRAGYQRLRKERNDTSKARRAK